MVDGNRNNEYRFSTMTLIKQSITELIRKGKLLLSDQFCDEAIQCFKRAWQLSRQNSEAPFLIGNCYLNIKKHTQAIAYYKRVLTNDPQHIWALNNLGIAFNEKGMQPQALECYDKAIFLNPTVADFYANRGKAFLNSSKFDEAIRDCQQAIALDPTLPSTYYNLGLSLSQAQRQSEALDAYAEALRLNANYFEVLCARAQLHQTMKQHQRALEDWTSALKLQPDAVAALNARGVLLKEGRRWQDALKDLNHALTIDPLSVPTLNNRGIVHHELGLWDAALADFEKILSISQTYPQALNNQANVWLDLGEHAKAIDCYQRALVIKPDYGWAQFNLGLCLLQMGDMAQGWRQYEWRWRRDESAKNPRQFAQPLWLGECPLQGKTLLVYAEQGLGDTLQFVRLIDRVLQQGAKVVLEIQVALKPLFDSWDDRVHLVVRGESLPDFDFQCPLLSLPLALGLSLSDLPSRESYISPDPAKVNKWRQKLGPSESLWVGLVWSGNPGLKNDLQRSMAASMLLSALPKGCKYVALHKEYRESDRHVFEQYPDVLDFSEELVDFSETAALCSCMSLIICVDTSVAHLSAAMGMPVWLMLPFNPDFRWLLNREDSPWYPSMRLFRQSTPREWQPVLKAVRSGLIQKISDSKAVQSRFLEAMHAHQVGNLEEVENVYLDTLQVFPGHADAWHLLGVLWAQRGNHSKAIEHFQTALLIHPQLIPAHFNLGLQLSRQGNVEGSVRAFQQAALLNSKHAEAHFQLAVGLQKLGRSEDALRAYGVVLNLIPDHYQSLCNRGVVFHEKGCYEEALKDYEMALSIRSDCVDALSNQSVTLNAMGEYGKAWQACQLANKLSPSNPVVLHNLGFSLQGLKKSDEAIKAYREALSVRTDYAECWNNLGNAQFSLGQHQDSIESHSQAIHWRPDFADAYFNRANVWFVLKQFDRAIEDYEVARQLNPDLVFIQGTLMHARMHACDWKNFQSDSQALCESVRQGHRAITPFALLGLSDDPMLLKQSSETYACYKSPSQELPGLAIKTAPADKIHLAYFSADFHNHATAYLMAELFELHDRSRFHVSAYSFGGSSGDRMRQRLVHAFDAFHDVREMSAREIVQLGRREKTDIAVDLKGFTRENRADIFALRAAPVQVSYLGYPGTLGMKTMDYLIADPTVVPESTYEAYSEKIALLPDCYQVNDQLRQVSVKEFTRKEMNLPDQGFVFCCFNNSYKILPDIFAGWMRILAKVPGSVLWLLKDNPLAVRHLQEQAVLAGVAPQRLVFAERMPLTEHLARHRLANLFLDTSPCNAHTTCSDALWAGLPVLTFPGNTFASRVSASLLRAIGLPECVQTDQFQYEAVAIALGNHPEKLNQLKQRLQANKTKAPLFDTPRFTRQIEALYEKMHLRRLKGLPPDHLRTDASDTIGVHGND